MFGWLRELFAALGMGARAYKQAETLGGSDADKAVAASDIAASLADAMAKAEEAKKAESK